MRASMSLDLYVAPAPSAFDFAVLDRHMVIDAGIGANVAVDDACVLADDGRAAHGAVDDLAPR